MKIENMILQGKTNQIFQTEFVVARGEFLSYCNRQLIKFEEDKRFGLYKQFCNIEK